MDESAQMIRSYFVVFVASAMLGILSGYLITSMLRDSMQTELQLLAQQLPIARTVATQDSAARAESPLYNRKDREKFLAEVSAVVKRAVVLSLQQHLKPEAKETLTQQVQAENPGVIAEPVVYEKNEAIRDPIVIARQVLAAAIARGYWDENDAQAYRESLRNVPVAAQREAYQMLSVAINNGEIQLTGDAPF